MTTSTKSENSRVSACVVCGSVPVESHHIAGRANHELTVSVCEQHHRLLTERQRLWRVPLSQGDRSEASRLSNLAVGFFHLMTLATASKDDVSAVGMLSSMLIETRSGLALDSRTVAQALSLNPADGWPIMVAPPSLQSGEPAKSGRARQLSTLILAVASLVCSTADFPDSENGTPLVRMLVSAQDDPDQFVAWFESRDMSALNAFHVEATAIAESWLDGKLDMTDTMRLYLQRALTFVESMARDYEETSHG